MLVNVYKKVNIHLIILSCMCKLLVIEEESIC